MKPKFLFLVFILFYYYEVSAQHIQNVGVPYVENYTKAVYQAGNQNWSITRDKNHIFYFGNSEGLLSFDGKSWQVHELPHHLIVRSVMADQKGRIYTGAFGEFGYWAYDAHAILKYHSLTHLVKDSALLHDEIWKIYVDGNRVIFQSFAAIFIYENGKIQVVKSNASFLFLFKVGHRFFVEVYNSGLFELKGKQLIHLAGSEVLGVSGILSILPFQEHKYLIGTAKDGLFIYDGQHFKPWRIPASNFLSTYQLNNGVQLFQDYFAFGTILNGVVIIDKDGHIVQLLNKSSGLQNNTVLSLFTDDGQNLWTGLDNGIDRIELNSPLYFYFDKSGAFGTVYSSIIYKGYIYLGTNQGLYYSQWHDEQSNRQSFDFKLIPNSQGQVWELAEIDGELFCGHNNGTFKVLGNQIQRISNISGGWTLHRLDLHSNQLIQGTYTGLAIFKKQGDGYVFSHKVEGFRDPARYVEQDVKGNIWVSHPYKGIFKLELSDDLTKVKSEREYSEKEGLPTTYSVNVFNLDSKMIFSTDQGFYIYDDINDRFVPFTTLNQKLGAFAKSNKVIKVDDHQYWFIDHGRVAWVDFRQAGQVNVDSNQFSILSGRMVQDYENISRINSHLFLISVDDGFVIYDKNNHVTPVKLPPLFIGKVENITNGNILLTESGSKAQNIKIKNSQNSIRINYALPYYRQAKKEYQYQLEGYSNRWSDWSKQTQKDFTNLPYGDYVFKVRARINGKEISKVSTFSFTVLPPFYFTIWAWITYFIIAVLLLYYFRRAYFKRLEKHQIEIKAQMELEKQEHLKREALINEQKLIKLKNEKLQAELDSKSREITNSAMNIVYKNELLQKITDELTHLADEKGNNLKDDQLKKIRKIINDGMNNERDWNLFEASFNETHENFFKKLKMRYPDLVPNDLKLCAYLRMNMSSKEMASLLNISVRGVEIRRYRLRKKLNLEHDKNLVEFLIEL
ncbi:MAG: transcriptional regulator [Sphingobacteriales bacterium]|nr:transcriptional regulator [Sphingobacteriales bacterium]